LLVAGIIFSCAGMAAGTEPNAAKKVVFSIREYQVTGNTLLPAVRIEEAVYRYLGENKSIDDVESARAALEKAYHDAGYLTALVNIPEQSVAGGIVKLNVTEGNVEKVRVVGSQYHLPDRILYKVPELAEGSVPYFPAVQKEMIAANSAADLRVTPVLRPGKTPGTVEAELQVQDQLPLHASIELNNYASPNTSNLRVAGMVRYDNLWQREHSLALQYQTSPKKMGEVRVFSGTYLMPIGNSDNKLAYYAVVSHSDVATVGDMTLLGSGDIVGVRWVIPLQSRERLFHTLTLGADYKHFLNDTLLSGANTGHTPVTYFPLSVAYSATMPDEAGSSAANAALNFQLRGMGDRMTECYGQVTTEFECNRYDAKPDYIYLRGGIERTQNLPRGLALFARLDGQLASGPLISNEMFTAGGADSVRGYYESEQAGDDGARGTLELRGPQWAKGNFNDLRAVAFFEGAHLRVREALPAQISAFNLASTGVGLRMQAWKNLTMALDAAWPLKDTTYTEAGKARFGFKAVGSF
jgi:hemolysin activation/secretion protein